jgi:predicted metal-dependent hydrolase
LQRTGCYLLASAYLASDTVAFMAALLRDDCTARGVGRLRLLRELGGAVRVVLIESPALWRGWLRYFGPLRTLV